MSASSSWISLQGRLRITLSRYCVFTDLRLVPGSKIRRDLSRLQQNLACYVRLIDYYRSAATQGIIETCNCTHFQLTIYVRPICTLFETVGLEMISSIRHRDVMGSTSHRNLSICRSFGPTRCSIIEWKSRYQSHCSCTLFSMLATPNRSTRVDRNMTRVSLASVKCIYSSNTTLAILYSSMTISYDKNYVMDE